MSSKKKHPLRKIYYDRMQVEMQVVSSLAILLFLLLLCTLLKIQLSSNKTKKKGKENAEIATEKNKFYPEALDAA